MYVDITRLGSGHDVYNKQRKLSQTWDCIFEYAHLVLITVKANSFPLPYLWPTQHNLCDLTERDVEL